MSVSSVVTRGYGAWSTVNKLPTWGYSIGAAVTSPAYETTRHILFGTATTRHVLHSTATTRHTLNATAETRHVLRGATP